MVNIQCDATNCKHNQTVKEFYHYCGRESIWIDTVRHNMFVSDFIIPGIITALPDKDGRLCTLMMSFCFEPKD